MLIVDKHQHEKAKRKYDLTAPFFLEKSLHRASTFLTPAVVNVLAAIPSLGLFSTLHEENEKAFSAPKLVQLFNRYATYNGSNPYKAPGILNIIPHLEFGLGAYLPKGGIHEITNSLVKLAKEIGVKFQFNAEVTSIETEGNKAKSVHTKYQTTFQAAAQSPD